MSIFMKHFGSFAHR